MRHMHPVRVFQVDAFTKQRFTGNPAGVVLEADALSDAQMQALARELNNGDTAFVLSATDPSHDVRVRFFTPRTEAAFVGHATLAAHAVLATLGLPPRPRQRQRSGLVEVDVSGSGEALRVGILQPPPSLRAPLDATALQPVLAALGLQAADLDGACPPTIAGESSTRLLLGVAEAGTLARLQPDLARLTTLSATLGAAGYFVFTRRPSLPDCATEARMFCPALGIAEDPVSGNAHGMLGAYLLRHELIGHDGARAQFTGAQGHYLGRPGRVEVQLKLHAGALESVRISGAAVVVFETEVKF
jgi:PhzF family phenazine biosynthesis protein